ncbi:MAG TPA: type II toxin-antitoxin system HicB family antitoxin [Candidatus Brocadiales bacterium]|nr:type II toxin-antitoxin system HicB family antitoxin [Candidatus Brocadiales bacterium]
MKYPVVIHKSKYGFAVYCPILPGCNSQGDTLEEALENIKDAIITYLDMVLRINPYTLKRIIKDAHLTDEQFKELI